MKIRRFLQGFTLIELLVVISIIAILAGFAVPAITSALVKGQLTGALNNGRQIHQAGMQMALDATTTGDPLLGWPGDLGSGIDLNKYVARLIDNGYLKSGDLKIFSAAGVPTISGTLTGTGSSAAIAAVGGGAALSRANTAYNVYPIVENDGSDVLFITTKNYTWSATSGTANLSSSAKPFGDKGFVVVRKGGDALSFKKVPSDANLIGAMSSGTNGSAISATGYLQ